VVVVVQEAHFVSVRVGVRVVTVSVLVHDVFVLVPVMRMVVDLPAVCVCMVVRIRVLVFLVHFPALSLFSPCVMLRSQRCPLPLLVT
jgi:hypothetical protein